MGDVTWSVVALMIGAIVPSIILHEVSHGVVALWLGDDTAKRAGRITLNPIKHIDPFGTVVLPMFLAISHAPVFGWAKPVPVNYRRLHNPRRDMVLVALAGPGMNLLLGLIGTAILAATIMLSGGADGGAAAIVAANALNFLLINIFLAVFNLLPVPPFDGGHVVEGLLPRSLARSFRKIGRYSLLVLVILLLILPAISPSANVVGRVVTPIVNTIATAFLRIFGLVA